VHAGRLGQQRQSSFRKDFHQLVSFHITGVGYDT
jgi:hypothetical protein